MGKHLLEHKKRLSMKEIYFLDGYLDAFDDFPDGAWQAACESAIERLPQYKGRGYDVWMEWCMANTSEGDMR